jgi:hypothetical protein
MTAKRSALTKTFIAGVNADIFKWCSYLREEKDEDDSKNR